MAYGVLARKWRPQRFEDVVGQDHVIRTLRNAIESERIANAYLFVGPRGIGKTSIARIFAKALDCKKGPTTTPCGKCDACREIAAGSSLDVMEIDGASNNGVDQVRDLRDSVKFAPAAGKYKIYIIDEVHMLSAAAFNALLKTLEEPPPHVKFIFATTEPEKILPTILSRCQRFDLRRIPDTLIAARLEAVAAEEGIEADGAALQAIARMAEGGLRDAESALDQLVSFCGKKIAEEDVLSVFGLVSRGTLESLAERTIAGDVQSAVRTVAELDGQGKDLQRMLADLLGLLRSLLVFLHVKDAAGVLDLTGTQTEVLARLAGMTTAGRTMRVVDILTQAAESMRFALSRRTVIETALIRCARAFTAASLDEVLAAVNELLSRPGGDGESAPETAGEPAASYAPPRPAVRPAVVRETREAPVRAPAEPAEASAAPAPQTETRPSAAAGDETALVRDAWPDIVAQAAKLAMAVRHLLADARPRSVGRDRVTVEVDREFASELHELEVPRNRTAVEMAVRDVLGRDVKVVFEAGDIAGEGGGGVRTGETRAAARRPRKGEAPETGSSRKKPWADDPAVRKVMDAFKGTIVEVRE
jgi:DNA polymerase-3 subunit gamma/tau